MRRLIILCVILLGESGSRAQLNYEGNPLTDNTEYTAEESHVSGRNARRDYYQRFEVADGRTPGATRGGPFSPSPRDDVAAGADFSRNSSNAAAPVVASDTGALSPLENDLTADVGKPQSAANNYKSESRTNETGTPERLASASASEAPTALQSPPEARQLREYSVQSSHPMSSSYPSHHDSYQSYQTYAQPEIYQSPQAAQLTNPAAPPATLATSQALTEFLNSRTPEESQMALQNYLAIRERAAAVQNGNSVAPDAAIPGQNALTEENSNAVSSNGYTTDEYLSFQRQEVENAQRLQSSAATKVVQDRTGQASYSPGLPYPPQTRLTHRLDWQQRFGPARQQQRPRYRGQTGRLRGRPWAQSRVDPRGPFYHPGGPVYGGPPPPPGPPGHPAGFPGKWKQSTPVEVIYTRPPGFAHPPPPPDSPGPHEDASHWFPEASQPPPQKDVYYSQLYAQSYDPHYYNYIAKTGKIKPWLYGKLGKHEEKSIWWELFSGFKKHGMKNMMNPMFLLGMTIPTLTIMLTALVQKRSLLGRADTGGRLTEEMIDEYAQRLRDYIECHERRIKEEDKDKKCW